MDTHSTWRNSRAAKLWLGVAILGCLYFASRFFRLEQLPLFLDEALHINAAWGTAARASSIGIEKGKWFGIVLYSAWFDLFGASIFTARGLAVAVGAATVGVLLRDWFVHSPLSRMPYAAWCYLIFPAAVFYDRVALTDQFVALGAALAILWSRMALRSGQFGAWARLFAVLIATPLIKASGAQLLLIPLTIYSCEYGWKGRPLRPAVTIGYLAVAAAVGLGTMKLLAFSSVAMTRPFRFDAALWAACVQSMLQVAELFCDLFTPVFVVGLFSGLAWAIVHSSDRRRVLTNLALVGVLVFPYIVGAQTWYPRYLFPAVVPLCLLSGDILKFLAERDPRSIAECWGVRGCAALVLGACAWQSASYVVRPERADYPWLLSKQYLTGWSAGTGLTEMADAIRELSESGSTITVMRLPLADQTLQGLNVHHRRLGPHVRLGVTRNWDDLAALAEELRTIAEVMRPLYLLLNDEYFVSPAALVNEKPLIGYGFKRIAFFPRPESERGLTLWEIVPASIGDKTDEQQ